MPVFLEKPELSKSKSLAQVLISEGVELDSNLDSLVPNSIFFPLDKHWQQKDEKQCWML